MDSLIDPIEESEVSEEEEDDESSSDSSVLLSPYDEEKCMALATERLYDLVNILPKEVSNVCHDIASTQKVVVTDTQNLSARVDGFQLFLAEWGKEMKRFESDLSSVSALEDWIKISTSEISQLKSQALFLNQCVDKRVRDDE